MCMLTCNLQGWQFRFAVNFTGSCPNTGMGAERLSGKVDTPHTVLSKLSDFVATPRAQQARARQHRPDKAGQQQARQSRPDVQKPPHLRRKSGQKEARRKADKAGQEQARSKPRANGTCTKRRACSQKKARSKQTRAKQKQAKSRPGEARNKRKVPKPPRL